jgi:predicted RNA-binding Zn-ribbon protein involved in translation (DUF1610 family)
VVYKFSEFFSVHAIYLVLFLFNFSEIKTTGVCPVCGTVVELKLSDREFTCPMCGSWFDRDEASALVIKDKGLCLWNAGETPGDDRANMMEYMLSILHVKACR